MVKKGVGPTDRYSRLRQKVLGLETYHGYDGGISVVDFSKIYDYEKITDGILESVAPLGDDYQKQLRMAFGNRWIDVFENEGKRGGAFSARVYGVHPYILLNYNETLSSTFSIAHEVGHSMHTMLAYENQPFATAHYTIFVAEIASNINEILFLNYMIEKSDDPVEKAALLQQEIDKIIGSFYGQVMFADFEWQAHQMVEAGLPITAKSLGDLYEKIWKEFRGEAVTFDSLYRATWTRIGHFHRTPYYVYKYATCYASAAQIIKGILSDDKKIRRESLDRYLTLLKSGGNDYPMEQLRKAGVDLTRPEAFQAVIDHLDNLVTQLENELVKLKLL
jgi:oligoendopeptidase F